MTVAATWYPILAVAILHGQRPVCRGQLVPFEPAVVQLTGTVVMEHVYGPPNFGETPDQDARYIIPVLHLDSAVCVVPGSPTRAHMNADTVADVRRVQLFSRRPDGREYNFAAWADARVVVLGTLSESVAPGEYTRVVIGARRISRASHSAGRPGASS